MKITDVKAAWLRSPIPEDKQHVSAFGRLTTLGFNPMLHALDVDDD